MMISSAGCSSEIQNQAPATQQTTTGTANSIIEQQTIVGTDASTLTFDPTSKECTERTVISDEYAGAHETWPIVEMFYGGHDDSELGRHFAAAACGENAIKKEFPLGTNQSGIYVTVYPAPSPGFRSALEAAGFIFAGEDIRYDLENNPITGEQWNLSKTVPVSTLLPLRKFVRERWSSNWGGLTE